MRGVALLLCLTGMAGACATAPRPAPAPTEAELIREAFTHPVLDWCDELSCAYLVDRHFRVRSVSCAPVPPQMWQKVPEVACSYERQPMPKHWMMPIISLDEQQPPPWPPEPLGPWEKARTRFMAHSERRWSVLQDPYHGAE